MSYQEPIFTSPAGLFGKANGFVVNAWTDAARSTNANAEGMDWAQRQVVQGAMNRTWLAKLTTASPISPNRWRYSFVAFNITDSAGPSLPNTTFGAGSNAVNIRELRNTAAILDGSPMPNGATAGPVGSSWHESSWTSSALDGYVWMHASYTPTGSTLFWFDTPNPVRCAPLSFNEGGGEGEGGGPA